MQLPWSSRAASAVRVMLLIAASSCGDGPAGLGRQPAQLVFSVQPTNWAAGSPLEPAVEVTVLDIEGFRVTDATIRISLAIGANPSNGKLMGTTAVRAVGGVAAFDSLSLDMVGSGYTLIASAPAVAGATSDAIDIMPGSPAALVFTQDPSDVTAGQLISPPVEVTVQDAFGNVVTDQELDVILQLGGGSASTQSAPAPVEQSTQTVVEGGQATSPGIDQQMLQGSTTVSTVNGVAAFDDLWIDKAANDYTLQAVAGSIISQASSPFTTRPAAPEKLGFNQQPSDGTADTPIAPVEVAVQDSFGNLVTQAEGTVTLTLGANASGATLSGTTTQNTIDGVATFADLSVNKAASGYSFTATAPGYSGTTSEAFAIGAGAMAELRFRTQPSDAVAYASIDPAVQVEILDHIGNLTTASIPVSVAIAANPGGGDLRGTRTQLSINGIATFPDLSIDRPANGYVLSASASGLSDVASDAFAVGAGTATQVRFTKQPSSVIAGAAMTPIEVAILDASGHLLTSATNAVTVSIGANPGGASLSGTQTVNGVGGVVTYGDLAIDKAATGYTLIASADGLSSASSDSLDVVPGPTARYEILDPVDGTVDAAITVTVRALDQFGNVATTENRDVTLLTTGSTNGGGVVSIVNGVGARLITDPVAETVTLRLADSQGTGLDVSSTQSVVFAPGTALQYSIVNPVDGIVQSPMQVTVRALDQFGNVATSENRDITLVTSGSATGSGLVDIQDGVGTREINDLVPETVILTLSDTEGTGLDVSSTQDVVFGPGAAVRFVILDPVDGTAPGPILVTVQALDQFGNVASSENRDVTLLTSGSASGGGRVPIVTGVGTRLISDPVAETVTLSLADTDATGLDVSSIQNVVFSSGAVTRYVILDPIDGLVETPVTVTVQAQDQFGNVVPSEDRDVTLVASGSATGGGLVDIQNGIGSRQINDAVPETVVLTLLDSEGTGIDVTSSQDLDFSAGTATRYVILDPVDGTVDAAISVTVVALDEFDNVAAGESRDVTLLTTGSATGGGRVSIVGGVGSLLISDVRPETVTLTLDDLGTGLDVSSTQDVVFAVGAVAQYAIMDPTDGVVNTPITVTVQAQDQFGNVVTLENRDVTLLTTGAATGGGVVDIQNGTGTSDINDAVPETVTLTLSDSDGTGLDVSSTQNVVFAAGGATRYEIVDPVDGTVPGTITVTVRALDQFGNVATAENRDVTLLTTGSATGGGLVNIVGGVGTRLISDVVAETVTLRLADTQATGLDVSSEQDVVFAPDAATRYVIIDPTDGVVNTPITVTVQSQDQFGNVVTSENRDVTLNTTGSATGAVPETVTLTLSDSEATGLDVSSTQNVVFSPGAATQYVIVDPIDGTVDAPIQVTVRALDQFGNIATSEFRDVTLLTTGSATGGGVVNIVAGAGIRLIADQLAETVNLSLADLGTGLDVSSTQDVFFGSGAVSRYAILNPTDGVVNTPITVTVQAQDQFANVVASENRDVTLLVSGSASGAGLVDIQNGSGTRAINDAVPETVTLTLSDTEGTGLNVSSTQNVAFSTGTATQYVILDPADGTVDAPIMVTVQAQDEFGNVVTTEGRDVTLLTTGSATGGGVVNIVGGVGARLISDVTPETVALTLVDLGTGLDVSSTQDVVFAVGAVARYTILDPTDGLVNTPITVTVQAQDQFGNVVPSENRDVTLLTTGSATGGGVVDIQNGTGTRSINDAVPETVVLTLSDSEGTGLDVTSTQDVVFFTGTTTKYVILNPVDGTVDAPITVTVQARDQFDNVVTTEGRDVTLLTSGSAAGGGRVNIVGGVGTRLISDAVAETVQLTLADTDGTGLDVSSTQDVVFAVGAVVRYVILDPTDGVVNTPVTVTVQAQDQFGNGVLRPAVGWWTSRTALARGQSMMPCRRRWCSPCRILRGPGST
jgi:phosphotransferase system IIA component/3'-phosphoadenosine 5'-phosphosulfate (PAPS) 3'-phosphatase